MWRAGVRIATGAGCPGNDRGFAGSAVGFLWCVGAGLRPSCGRPQGSPLRRVARSAVRRADVGIGPYGWVFFTLLKSLAEFASADAKNSNHFSPRPVRGEKYLSGCKCGILSQRLKIMRAADCKPFGRKIEDFSPGLSYVLSFLAGRRRRRERRALPSKGSRG